MPDIPKGRFVWYELMTTDPDSAKGFYQNVVGWGTAPFEGGPEGMPPYTMWLNGETPLGGLMELPEEAQKQGAPPHWLAYIATPDVEKTIDRATSLGASIVMPIMEIEDVGRMAILKDPQGAMFAAYTPSGSPPAGDGPPETGGISWHELATTDWKAADKFYGDLFGWNDAGDMDMGEAGTYHMFGKGETPYGGMFNKPPEMPAPPHWLLYAKVSDLGQAIDKVRKGGGQILNGPMDVPGGEVVQCLDPQGAMFALHMEKDA